MTHYRITSIAGADTLAAYLLAAGVSPEGVAAALAPPRSVDLEAELSAGYEASCERWGKPPASGAARLEGEDEGETVAPPARRQVSTIPAPPEPEDGWEDEDTAVYSGMWVAADEREVTK